MIPPYKKYYTAEDYYNMPEDIRVELIDGKIIYMDTPNTLHQLISGELSYVINSYIKSKGSKCRIYFAPFAVQLRKENDTVVEPDISVICDLDKLNDRGCLGAPDWIIEIISPSNPSHDYITKLALYHEAGVREYWIADPQSNYIHVYNLETGKLDVYTFNDTVKAGIYEDLFIDFARLDLDLYTRERI